MVQAQVSDKLVDERDGRLLRPQADAQDDAQDEDFSNIACHLRPPHSANHSRNLRHDNFLNEEC